MQKHTGPRRVHLAYEFPLGKSKNMTCLLSARKFLGRIHPVNIFIFEYINA